MDNKHYYDDIELDETIILEDSNSLSEIFQLKDLKQRKIFLNGEIDSYNVDEIVKHILQFNREDVDVDVKERYPIKLYITSIGGSVDDGFKLIDAILISKTPVWTINLGYQYSMGFLIGIAGHKRFATPNAKFMMHDGSLFAVDSSSKVMDTMEFQQRVEERTKKFVLNHSHVSSEEYDSKRRVEWYMFADEAKEKGFVDYIIGQDCDISSAV